MSVVLSSTTSTRSTAYVHNHAEFYQLYMVLYIYKSAKRLTGNLTGKSISKAHTKPERIGKHRI